MIDWTPPCPHRITRSLLISTCVCTWLASTAWAQTEYARVIEATPIYQEVLTPNQDCTEIGKQQRCEITTHREEHLVGYDVLYEYKGQQHMQRMANHPGQRVPVQTTHPGNHYGSKHRSTADIAQPGQKSYGSTAPGAAVVESIQYQSDEAPPWLNLEMRAPTPPLRR